MPGKIFITYRRGDEPRHTTALYMRLEEEFGRGNVIMDVEAGAEPGDRFAQELGALVAPCDVLLAVIGPRWAERLAARAGDPNDFVAIEIQAALDQGKAAIPVLVGGATLPRPETLPEAIRGLVVRGAVTLPPDQFESGCEGLIKGLRESFAAAGVHGPSPEARRQAADANRKRQVAEEAARAAQAGQRAQEPATAASSPEDIRRAGEIAKWDLIKDSKDPEDFRDHLARFPNGPTGRDAHRRLEALVWDDPATHAGIEGLQKFIEEFPEGERAEAAQSQLARLEEAAEDAARLGGEKRRDETEAWAKAAASHKIPDMEAFLNAWPNGIYADSARRRLSELEGAGKGEKLALIIMLGIVALMVGLIALAGVKLH